MFANLNVTRLVKPFQLWFAGRRLNVMQLLMLSANVTGRRFIRDHRCPPSV